MNYRPLFKVNDTVKHVDFGDPLRVIDVIPNGLTVLYVVETERGDRMMLHAEVLRPWFKE